MPKGERRKYEPEFKLKIVLAALRGECSQQELARRHNVNATMIGKWKEKFLQGGQSFLGQDQKTTLGTQDKIRHLQEEITRRDQVIGELTVSCRMLKKSVFPD